MKKDKRYLIPNDQLVRIISSKVPKYKLKKEDYPNIYKILKTNKQLYIRAISSHLLTGSENVNLDEPGFELEYTANFIYNTLILNDNSNVFSEIDELLEFITEQELEYIYCNIWPVFNEISPMFISDDFINIKKRLKEGLNHISNFHIKRALGLSFIPITLGDKIIYKPTCHEFYDIKEKDLLDCQIILYRCARELFEQEMKDADKVEMPSSDKNKFIDKIKQLTQKDE